MQNKVLIVIASGLLLWGCSEISEPYAGELHTLTIEAAYPEEFAGYVRQGVRIKIEEVNRGNTYFAATDNHGRASVALTAGIYRIMLSDRIDGNIFNGTAENVLLDASGMSVALPLIYSRAGTIVIKEVYCGGVAKSPHEGNYQSDKYIILHNNDSETQYLDGLCFGTLDPYNSQGTNVWDVSNLDFVPVVQCVWQFGGEGDTFPLAPGQDAVLAVCGAIDHAAQYPLSVNLNREGYFVCYNNVYFPNTLYHPAPGDRIVPERYLNVVIKTGQANAYTFSVYSPAVVLFRAKGTTIQDFVAAGGNVIQKPGSTVDRIVKIPLDWVTDGVEVFYGGSSNNKKRIPASIDAGYVYQSALYTGRTLHRKVDEDSSAKAGYEVLEDSNNSASDFYEREQQSLHE